VILHETGIQVGLTIFYGRNNFLRRSQWPCGLRHGSSPLGCWDRGFESRSRPGCLSVSFCVVLCCPVSVEALRRADHSSKESYYMSKLFKKPPICEAARVLQGL
jgi:hypothetical protein